MSERKTMSKRVRRYDFRTTDGREWLGTFLVTDDGLVCCATDYGSYSHWWTSTGYDDIRKFLLKIDTCYLLGKFASKEEYDGDATERAIRKWICQARRDRELTKEEAREHWDTLNDNSVDNEFGFGCWLRETDIGDAWEMAVHRTSPQASAFAERVWPRFCQALRDEMAAEMNAHAF